MKDEPDRSDPSLPSWSPGSNVSRNLDIPTYNEAEQTNITGGYLQEKSTQSYQSQGSMNRSGEEIGKSLTRRESQYTIAGVDDNVEQLPAVHLESQTQRKYWQRGLR